MNLKQMFPKDTLDGEDLYAYCRDNNAGQPVTVTIEKLDYKTRESDQLGGAEIAYYLHVREFKKPFKLSKSRAEIIAEVLGTAETDDWDGRTIKVKGDVITFQGQRYWVIQPVIDPPDQVSSLPKKMDITGTAFRPRLTGSPVSKPPQGTNGGAKPLGIDRAIAMVSLLAECGLTPDDAVKHVQKAAPQIAPDMATHRPPMWPDTAAPWIAQLCRSMPRSKPPMSDHAKAELKAEYEKPEVIDPKTGELQNAVAGGLPPVDDIPF